MTMNGKALMVEFDEGQNEHMFVISSTRELAYGDSRRGTSIRTAANSLSLASSFVQICYLPKPVVFPSPPSLAHAENYIPHLTDGDGIFIFMDDMDGNRVWVFRYRYWQNNNSRMFVLEKTGDFVKAHSLGAGDVVLIYIDEQTGRYGIQAKKGEKKEVNPVDSEKCVDELLREFFPER